MCLVHTTGQGKCLVNYETWYALYEKFKPSRAIKSGSALSLSPPHPHDLSLSMDRYYCEQFESKETSASFLNMTEKKNPKEHSTT